MRPLWATGLLAAAVSGSAVAGDLGAHATVAELRAALPAETTGAAAYVAGLVDTTMLRGMGGDPEVEWLHRCIVTLFIMPDQVVTDIGPWLDGKPEFAGTAPAAAAVMAFIAERCKQ